jgi:predicted Zn-dependent protease
MVKVTLSIEDQKTLTAAQGYMELNMPREALAELTRLTPEGTGSPPGLEMRIVVLLKLHRWKPAATTARKLCRILPDQPAGFVHLAFCLHELGETVRARDVLRKAPPNVRRDATCCYNLACYEAVLGELDAARLHLAQSISIDKRFRDFARNDSDLAPLHKELQ